MKIKILLPVLFIIALLSLSALACKDGGDFICKDGPASCVPANHPLTAPEGNNPIDTAIDAVENLCETAGYHRDVNGNCVE